MHPEIKVTDWVARYPGVEEAAEALGCDRVTLWRWRNTLPDGEGFIPEPWAYKALALSRKGPKRPRKGD